MELTVTWYGTNVEGEEDEGEEEAEEEDE